MLVFDRHTPNEAVAPKVIDPRLLRKHPGSRIEIVATNGEAFRLELQTVHVTTGRRGRPRPGDGPYEEERLVKLYGDQVVRELRDDDVNLPARYRIVSPSIRTGKKFVIQEVDYGIWETVVVRSCVFLTTEDVVARAVAAKEAKAAAKQAAKAARAADRAAAKDRKARRTKKAEAA